MKIDEKQIEKALWGTYSVQAELDEALEQNKQYLEGHRSALPRELNPLIKPKLILPARRLVPDFKQGQPGTPNYIKIIEATPIFEGKCGLVKAELSDRELVYFEPLFDQHLYKEALKKDKSRVSLGGIVQYGTLSQNHTDSLSIEQSDFKQCPQLHPATLGIIPRGLIEAKRSQGIYFYRALTKNPLTTNAGLDLLLSSHDPLPSNTDTRIKADLFLVGRLR